ncbi:MAG: hypothetical protein ACE5LS_02885 [Thermoplasmata archaeon]
MTHCRGCGGYAQHVHSREFVHLIGCGWRIGQDEARAAPSSVQSQRKTIRHALKRALGVKEQGGSIKEQVDAFVDHLLEELDEYQEEH